MLAPIKNRKEINKSFYNIKKNVTFGLESPKNSILNLQNNNQKLILSQFHNNNIFTKIMKKNPLTPINKNNFHKVKSMYNMYQNQSRNNNNKDLLNISQIFKNYGSGNNSIQEIKPVKNFQNNNKSNSNIKNFTGYNTTKNNNTAYTNSNNYSKYFNFSIRMNKKNKNFSKFFFKSQSKFITSKRIFRHYIREEEREKVTPIKYFLRGGAPKSIKEIKKLYKEKNFKFDKRIKEIKSNTTIAFKDDFNILDYQTTLIRLLSKRVSDTNLNDLQKNFVVFNEKNFGMVGPKGRFTNMAEKIKYNIPSYLYEKIKKLDSDKLISRYNYYKNSYDNIKKKFASIKKKKNKSKDLSKENIKNQINNSY